MGFIVRLLGQGKHDAIILDNPRLERKSPLLTRFRRPRILITDSHPFCKSSKRRFFGTNEVNKEWREGNHGLTIRNESAEILSSALFRCVSVPRSVVSLITANLRSIVFLMPKPMDVRRKLKSEWYSCSNRL